MKNARIMINTREVMGRRQSLPREAFIKVALLHKTWCTALQGPTTECNCSPWAHIATKKGAIIVFSNGRAVRDWRRGRVIDAEVIEP